RAGLSLTRTMSKGSRPARRPAGAASLRYPSASSRSGPCFNRPTAATTTRMRDDTHGPCARSSRPTASSRSAGGSARPSPVRSGRRPHLLEIVEGADFRPEDVDDDVAGIDQHPVAVRHAFDPRVPHAGLDGVFDDAV